MAKKKTALQRSEFGKINLVNVFNAVYHGLNAGLTACLALYITQGYLSRENIIATVATFLTTVLGSIFKGMNTGQSGIPFNKK